MVELSVVIVTLCALFPWHTNITKVIEARPEMSLGPTQPIIGRPNHRFAGRSSAEKEFQMLQNESSRLKFILVLYFLVLTNFVVLNTLINCLKRLKSLAFSGLDSRPLYASGNPSKP